ncbi:hypothetical protein NDU88_002536 [Pleurodeles waltl]|uniref:Uncharacterized protein n=1 Tax=Pleurodeles waltl TaxID=8319 RepID=A0AAV7W4U9_PLEWA|nr:hypothetical protein NDU88_002536 [Pleurodeles waltl]
MVTRCPSLLAEEDGTPDGRSGYDVGYRCGGASRWAQACGVLPCLRPWVGVLPGLALAQVGVQRLQWLFAKELRIGPLCAQEVCRGTCRLAQWRSTLDSP